MEPETQTLKSALLGSGRRSCSSCTSSCEAARSAREEAEAKLARLAESVGGMTSELEELRHANARLKRGQANLSAELESREKEMEKRNAARQAEIDELLRQQERERAERDAQEGAENAAVAADRASVAEALRAKQQLELLRPQIAELGLALQGLLGAVTDPLPRRAPTSIPPTLRARPRPPRRRARQGGGDGVAAGIGACQQGCRPPRLPRARRWRRAIVSRRRGSRRRARRARPAAVASPRGNMANLASPGRSTNRAQRAREA